MLQMKVATIAPSRGRNEFEQDGFEQDEFENIVLAELQELRRTEKALQKMYPRLKSKPQLRTRFLEQLADMQQRAHRLDAVLSPVSALEFAPVPVMQSSVA
jgi:division protein CdvB (Snf7/Vps24/ESCRT-III family)